MEHLSNSFSAQFGLLRFFIRDNYTSPIERHIRQWLLFKCEVMIYKLINKEEQRLKEKQ